MSAIWRLSIFVVSALLGVSFGFCLAAKGTVEVLVLLGLEYSHAHLPHFLLASVTGAGIGGLVAVLLVKRIMSGASVQQEQQGRPDG